MGARRGSVRGRWLATEKLNKMRLESHLFDLENWVYSFPAEIIGQVEGGKARIKWEKLVWSQCMLLLFCLIPQLYLTLCDPMDYSPPGSSVHGISQSKILEWVAISYSRGSSWFRDGTHISWVSCIGSQIPLSLSQWWCFHNVTNVLKTTQLFI